MERSKIVIWIYYGGMYGVMSFICIKPYSFCLSLSHMSA